jgi:hypothetical protein
MYVKNIVEFCFLNSIIPQIIYLVCSLRTYMFNVHYCRSTFKVKIKLFVFVIHYISALMYDGVYSTVLPSA